MKLHNYFKKIGLFALLFAMTTGFVFAQNEMAEKRSQRAETHRSTVSEVAQKLNQLANNSERIGPAISEIAREQNENKDRAVTAIEKIEARKEFRTFLAGTDYKNIGVIRSTLVTTENHIERLRDAQERTSSDFIKKELQGEIDALEQEREELEGFIQENEEKFSLFGWLVRWVQK